MIPGSNLLNKAFTLIGKTTVSYYTDAGRTVNAVGQYVTSYSAAANVTGSLQAVKQELYDKYGLDFQKKYYMLYVSRDAIDVGRDVSGDQFEHNGYRYQCESLTNWYSIDGWVSILAVQVSEVA